LADATERTGHGFTPEQLEFLREEYGQKAAQGFDRPTQMWLIGGLVAMGLAVAGMIWTQIGENRMSRSASRCPASEIRENRAAIGANRDAIAELAEGVARIEAILEERLPRDR
jgi:hypothetical protein